MKKNTGSLMDLFKVSSKDIHRFNIPKLISKAIQEFQGIAAAIIYDGSLDNNEIDLLSKWLLRNDEYLTGFPLSDFKKLFNDIVVDGIVDHHERNELFGLLKSIANTPEGDPVVENIFDDAPVTFADNYFAFTADMIFGDRDKAIKAVLANGGHVSNSVTLTTNYLIVGDLGSENYKYGRFGKKIERAIYYKRKYNSTIAIIKEEKFVSALLR